MQLPGMSVEQCTQATACRDRRQVRAERIRGQKQGNISRTSSRLWKLARVVPKI